MHSQSDVHQVLALKTATVEVNTDSLHFTRSGSSGRDLWMQLRAHHRCGTFGCKQLLSSTSRDGCVGEGCQARLHPVSPVPIVCGTIMLQMRLFDAAKQTCSGGEEVSDREAAALRTSQLVVERFLRAQATAACNAKLSECWL